jgi:drug/metabolite transporter (DMT)-like permease
MRRPIRAAVWMTVAQLLFASMAVGARIGSRDVPWQEVCASRFLVGALTAYVVARARGQSLRIANAREAWFRSGFGTLAAAGTFFLYAAPALAIGDAATLLATSPIFVALMSAPLLGEPIRRGHVLALALGFGGIALVAQPTFSTAGHLVAIGAATAVSSAVAMIWLRRIGPNESSEAIVFHFACVGSCVMLLASVPVWRTPGARDGVVLFVTGLCAGLAQIAMTRAYALDHAARVSALAFSGVVFARVLAVPIFGEVPNATQAIGSLSVIGSGVLIAIAGPAATRVRRVRARAQPPSR